MRHRSPRLRYSIKSTAVQGPASGCPPDARMLTRWAVRRQSAPEGESPGSRATPRQMQHAGRLLLPGSHDLAQSPLICRARCSSPLPSTVGRTYASFMQDALTGPLPGRVMRRSASGYVAPDAPQTATVSSVVAGVRELPPENARRLSTTPLFPEASGREQSAQAHDAEPVLFYAGNLSLLSGMCIAVVGSRGASDVGLRRAERLSRELSENDVVTVSGLAAGIDTAAHRAAIAAGGHTIAVIGTPLERAYPAENAALQETIWRNHLLVSPFAPGTTTHRSSFPMRNKVMAALTDATVIIEASDTSGALHQAAECARLNRWLFISSSVVESTSVNWPAKFLASKGGANRVRVLTSTSDLLAVLRSG